MKLALQNCIRQAWRRKSLFFYLILLPVSKLFSATIALRRAAYRLGYIKSYLLPVPVIVVGNINMGGSGKTPVVIWLIQQLKQQGYQPGIISRGYGSTQRAPAAVLSDSQALDVGDEPLLMALRCGCPVWIGANRVEAGQALLASHPECDVIVSDDGLQHYRLQRTVELAVVDAETLQNKHLLPAGPLREPPCRLKTVDAVIYNGLIAPTGGFSMQLVGQHFYHLREPSRQASAADFKGKSITAIAGIGKPERFFAHLMRLGLTFVSQSFADHHHYQPEDITNITSDIVIMTEKDAVKCQAFATDGCWVLPIEAELDAGLLPMVLNKIRVS